MRMPKKRFFFTLFIAVLCVGPGLGGCTSSRTPEAESPANKAAALSNPEKPIRIYGAITHVHEPDNGSSTLIDIVIGDGFEGTLPDDIDAITVTGPNGKLSFEKSDFNYYPQFRDFWISIPSVPEIGAYTFMVTSGNRTGSASDVLTNLKKLPVPGSRTMSPAAGATITTKSPHFSWKTVDADSPLYYRVDIKDPGGKYIYRTDYVKDMFSAKFPPYILEAGKTYLWRVRVADDSNWILLNNRSHSLWRKVTVAPTPNDREYSYQIPPETDDGWQTNSLSEEGVNEQKISDLMRRILNGYDVGKNVHSVLLVKNGKLILEEYFCGSHRNHIHHIQSDTKSIVSLLVGIAHDRGLLPGLETEVFTFFPEYSGAKWIDQRYPINLKNVLTMTAGLDWDERSMTYGHPRNDNTAMNRSTDWIKYVLDRESTAPPGKRFNYSGGLSILLGGIIKNTSG